MSRPILLASAIFASLVSYASAQDNPSAAELVTQFTTASDSMGRVLAYRDLRRALGRENATVTAAMADSIAKSLAQIAIRADNRLRATDAIGLLVLSTDARARVRYPEAFARLREIVEQATDPGTNAAALAAMADLPDNTQVIRYVASFLEGKTRVDPSREIQAIQLLASQFGPEGRAALRRIDEANTVQDYEVRGWLRSLRANGYSLQTR